MQNVSFFTPISYGNLSKSAAQSVMEAADDYFYLGGKKACVIAGRIENEREGVVLTEGSSSWLASALKIASYFTGVIPLLVLIVKTVLRYQNQFHVIDPKAELERGIQIDPTLIAKIQQLIPKIQRRKEDSQIQWLSLRGTQVFRFTETPHLVFKLFTANNTTLIHDRFMNGDEQIRNRFNNTVKAKEVCLVHQLDSITIPQAKMFEVKVGERSYPVIAEQSLDIRATDSAQEEVYREHAANLTQAVRQLGTFISETGFNDVVWRNVPVIDEAAGFQGAPRIGLVDLEHMEDARAGILGSWNGSCGLVRCLFSEEQIDTVLNDAEQRGVITQNAAQRIKAERLEEIRLDRQLLDFYQRKGIWADHRKRIEVDVSTLGLNLDEVANIRELHVIRNGTNDDVEWIERQSTMREAVEKTVAEINRLIQETAASESVKGKRNVFLETSGGALYEYGNFDSNRKEGSKWLPRIIDALVKKGHLFKLERKVGSGYRVQA